MSFTAGTVLQKIKAIREGGFKLVQGTATFGTTSLSGDVDCLIKTIYGYTVEFTSAPSTRTEAKSLALGTVSATTPLAIIAPPYAGTLIHAKLVVNTTVATDDTNFWTFRLINKGNTDADMILATDANTNKATGGSAITAYTPRTLTRHGTAANYAFAANDVLYFTATKAASAANLVAASLQLGYDVGNQGEHLYLTNAFSSGSLTRPSSGKLTFARQGPNPSSAATIAFSYWGV